MSAPRSLADRLARALTAWVAIAWLCVLAGVVWYVDREINRNFDSEMTESAHRMIDIAVRDYEHETRDGRRPAQPLVGREPLIDGDPVVFQLVDDSGRVLMRSRETPAERFAVALRTGFQDAPPWRIYTVAHPRAPLFLHLADPLAERARHRWQTLVGLALPLLALVPVFVWGLRRIARRELRGVEQLGAQIAERGGADLRPLALTGLPTELASVGEHVNRLLMRLGDALDAERALAANAAHELRTPLAAARLRLQSALDGELSREDIEGASTALARLVHRCEKLLQLSRAESAAASSRSEVDLVRLVLVVVDEMADTDPRAARIGIVLDDGIRPAAGDADTLGIALRNLLENALRHAGGARVEVRIEAPSTLVVSDAGPGVPPAALASLRERHVRAGADRAGYGLGLSIVGSIASRHDARLELVSPRPGTTGGFMARLVLHPYGEDGPAAFTRPDDAD